MPQYQVYVLKNDLGRKYIGLSSNIEKRLFEHSFNQSVWTRFKGPWNLVWCSKFLSLSEARKLENTLKAQKGGNGFYKITGLSQGS